jgi:hypothetical protein
LNIYENEDEDEEDSPNFMNTETMITVSPAQLAANLANAQKSTGPKTVEGKAAVRLNAVKHGLLAQTVLVRGRQFRESAQGLKRLSAEFHANLAPVGPLEEMLVDEIIQATWRLRRARRAESGEMALTVDEGWLHRQDQNPVPRILAGAKSPFSGLLRPKLERSRSGCAYLMVCLRKLRAAVEADGELTEEALADFESSLGNEPDLFASILSYGAGTEETPKEEAKAKVLDLIKNEMERLIQRDEECEVQEESEERERQAASVLPKATVLDRILRYETALERQLYRAMSQLERLQRRRQGENVPPPVAIQTS